MNIKLYLRGYLRRFIGNAANGVDLDDAVEFSIIEWRNAPPSSEVRDFLAAYLQFKGFPRRYYLRLQTSDKRRKRYLRKLRQVFGDGEERKSLRDFDGDWICRCGARCFGELALVGHAFEHEVPIAVDGVEIASLDDYLKLSEKKRIQVLEELVGRYYRQVMEDADEGGSL